MAPQTRTSDYPEPHAVVPGVADKPLAAQKADEGEAEFRGQLDGQARGGRDARHDGEAGDQGFLDDFKAPAAAHEQQTILEWEALFHQGPADQLIDGIVATHVLPQRGQPIGRDTSVGRIAQRLLDRRADVSLVALQQASKLVNEIL